MKMQRMDAAIFKNVVEISRDTHSHHSENDRILRASVILLFSGIDQSFIPLFLEYEKT